MTSTVRIGPALVFALTVSFLGLLFVGFLSAYSPASDTIPWRTQIVSLVFGSLCLLAANAVFFPNVCAKAVFGRAGRRSPAFIFPDQYTTVFGVRLTHGHHSTLKDSSGHEFRVKSKSFCASCTGILIGSLVSLGGVIVYSTMLLHLAGVVHLLVATGIGAVAAALIVPIFHSGRAALRVFINAVLVIGMLLILIGVDALTANFSIDLYIIGLSVFWMVTRILMSERPYFETDSPEGPG